MITVMGTNHQTARRSFNTWSLIALLFIAPFTCHAKDVKKADDNLPLAEMQQFTRVINLIKMHYVRDEDDKKLFEDAIRGMLAGLDPHSSYLDEDDYDDLRVSTSGKFGGLGIEVTIDNGFVRVVTPIDDTPAAKAGVKAKDIIIKIDDTPIKGISLREAVDKMRGDPGSTVKLTLLREGAAGPIEVKLVRQVIKVASTKYHMLEDHIGYIRLTHFQTNGGQNVLNAISDMEKTNKGKLAGLILDLRNNPGGVLDSAVDISDIFLDSKKIGYNKLIVYTEGKVPESRIREVAKSNDHLNGKPMVVLVNEGSASASEIVAGALQDHKRAIIMGNNTFGKGSVQTVLPLTKKSGLKLTTAFYYTPSGRSIQAEGIEPDIVIKHLSLKEAKDSQDDLGMIREANLDRHLETHSKNENKDAHDDDTALALEDYPLYQALNVLKGLVLYSEKH